jgi:hypothetical protein
MEKEVLSADPQQRALTKRRNTVLQPFLSE